MLKKTERGKNRCSANNGHKSNCTRGDIQSVRITDKRTGITTFEPKIYRIRAIMGTAAVTCSVSSCIRNFHCDGNDGAKFTLRDGRESGNGNCAASSLPSVDTVVHGDGERKTENGEM